MPSPESIGAVGTRGGEKERGRIDCELEDTLGKRKSSPSIRRDQPAADASDKKRAEDRAQKTKTRKGKGEESCILKRKWLPVCEGEERERYK